MKYTKQEDNEKEKLVIFSFVGLPFWRCALCFSANGRMSIPLDHQRALFCFLVSAMLLFAQFKGEE